MFGYVKKKVVRAAIERRLEKWKCERDKYADEIRRLRFDAGIGDEDFEFIEEYILKNGARISSRLPISTNSRLIHYVTQYNMYANWYNSNQFLMKLLELEQII